MNGWIRSCTTVSSPAHIPPSTPRAPSCRSGCPRVMPGAWSRGRISNTPWFARRMPPMRLLRVARELLGRLARARGGLGDHLGLQLVEAGEDEGRPAAPYSPPEESTTPAATSSPTFSDARAGTFSGSRRAHDQRLVDDEAAARRGPLPYWFVCASLTENACSVRRRRVDARGARGTRGSRRCCARAAPAPCRGRCLAATTRSGQMATSALRLALGDALHGHGPVHRARLYESLPGEPARRGDAGGEQQGQAMSLSCRSAMALTSPAPVAA